MNAIVNLSEVAPRRILVPLDWPFCDRGAVSKAADVARRTSASIYLLHVFDGGSFMNGMDALILARSDQEVMDDLSDQLRTFASDAVPRDMQVRSILRKGRPRREIVREARRLGIDLILMEGQRDNRLIRWLMPGIAESVFRHAPCPVVLVPDCRSETNSRATPPLSSASLPNPAG